MTAKRKHNEWFHKVKATTCECGTKKTEVWTWGVYVRGKFRSILRCCEVCFDTRVVPRLTSHAAQCGCAFTLVSRHGSGALPAWIKLPAEPLFGSAEDRNRAAEALYKLLRFAAIYNGGVVDDRTMRAVQAQHGGNTAVHDELVNYLVDTGRVLRDGTRLVPVFDTSGATPTSATN